jgi:hypothetical protein
MMRADRPGRVLAILVAVWALFAALSMWRGGLYVLGFETDMTHLVQILLRLEAGERVHAGFSTPLGAWAFWPIQALMAAGVPMGRAIIGAQVLVALVLVPGLWWAGASRLRSGPAIALGLAVLVIAMALTYGGTNASVTFAMHYNRWGWAIVLPVLVIAMLPGAGWPSRGWVADGVVVGAAMVALAMIKVSFFVCFAPVVILGLAVHGNVRALALALAIGLGGLAVLTGAEGVGYWAAYIGDLRLVAGSTLRAAPGDSLAELVAAPSHIAATLALGAAVLILRRADRNAALLLLVMAPGAYYVTFQNYANDPVWLILVGLMMVQLAPDRQGGTAMRGVAVAAAVFVLPVLVNLATSVPRHAFQLPGGFRPLAAGWPGHGDVQIAKARLAARMYTLREAVPPEAPRSFAGRIVPACKLSGGFLAGAEEAVAEMKAAGVAPNRQPYVADLFMPHWLVAGWAPLPGGAPWYYDGLPGIEAASHLIVPDCPVSEDARARVLELIEARKLPLEEAFRGTRFTLYRILR